jgi:mannosylglycerate hydrolase
MDRSNIKVHVISNTHWDREWYLSFEKYRVRLVKLMDRVIKIMQEKKSYIFVTDGQYIIIKDYLEARPEKEEAIRQLMKENRLKVGPWYTQPLETLVTGEAMVRNLFYGLMETNKYGKAMKFSYMVDEFGHASQTPQILKGFGINEALAWRGMENKANGVFKWASPSGDYVIMHRSPLGYGEATALPWQMEDFAESIDGQVFERDGLKTRIDKIKALKDPYSQIGVQFWLNGIDHSWAQEDILEVIDRINEMYDELDITQTTLEDYAQEVKEEYAREGLAMQTCTGELMHPDEQVLVCIHSIRADQKRLHYKAERLMEKWAEPISSIAWLYGSDYHLWALQRAWKLILENHAHDSLGCCSVDSVYRQVMARYDSAISIGEQLVDDSLAYMASLDAEDRSLYAFNTNSSGRVGAICCVFDIPKALDIEEFDLLDENENRIPFNILSAENLKDIRYNAQYGHPSVIMSNRYLAVIDTGDFSGLSLRRFKVAAKTGAAVQRKVDNYKFGIMENKFFRVEITENGCINLYDRRTGKEYKQLLQIADSGECGDFYNHRRPLNNKIITNANVKAEIKRIYDTDLLQEYEIRYSLDIPVDLSYDKKSRSDETALFDVKIKIRLLKGVERIDADIELENRSKYHQARVLFPSGITGADTSLSGQPFDVVERRLGIPEGFDFEKDPNCEYHPMQDFCTIQSDGYGLAIAAKGIFEYEAVNDELRTLALTILRAADFESITSDQVVDRETELSYLKTKVSHEISIVPYAGDWKDAYPAVLDFTNPPKVFFRKSPDEAFLPGYKKPAPRFNGKVEFIKLDGKNVFITAVKREDQGEQLIVRLVNLSDEAQNVRVTINENIVKCKEISRLNLNEEQLKSIGEGNTAEVNILTKQVYTLGFKLR